MLAYRMRVVATFVLRQRFTGLQTVDNMAIASRGVHTHVITKSINYITNDNRLVKADQQTLKLEEGTTPRPISVMLKWMKAEPRHLNKYSKIYLDMGYDVVTVGCTAEQLVWPASGAQVVAAELLKFLKANENYNHLVVHGFSIGAYVWAELLLHVLNDSVRYQPVLDRVASQVWDSPGDLGSFTAGLAYTLFPHNKPMRTFVRAFAWVYSRALYNSSRRHFLTAMHNFRNTPCHAPTLFLMSRTDPVSSVSQTHQTIERLTAAGIKCNWRCWEASPHVQHYHQYPEEYLEALYSHFRLCGLMS